MQLRTIENNIKYFYISEFFYNLLFNIPIWITYYRSFMSFSEMATLSAISVIITMILQLPTGAFADIYGRRTSCIIGAILYVIAFVGIAFAGDKYFLMGIAVLKGTAEAFISGANISLLYDSLKQLGKEDSFAKIRANSIVFAQIAIIVSSIVGGYLYNIWMGLPYLFCAASLVLSGLFYSMFKEPDLDSEKYSFNGYVRKMKDGFKHIFKNAKIKQLSIYYIFVGAITTALQFQFNMILAEAIGYGDVERGWLFAIIRFVNAFLLIKLFKIDRFFTRSKTLLKFASFIVIATIFGAIDFKPLGTIILFATTLANTLKMIVFDKMVNAEFDSHLRATSLSALSMLVSIMYTIVTFIAGFAFEKYFPGVVYTSLGIIILLFVIPIVLIYDKKNASQSRVEKLKDFQF